MNVSLPAVVFAGKAPTDRQPDRLQEYDLADPLATLSYLFIGGIAPCVASLDANGDLYVTLVDAIYSLTALFNGGPLPPEPFPNCGVGDTLVTLGCGGFPACL